jgi:hypothetical protein
MFLPKPMYRRVFPLILGFVVVAFGPRDAGAGASGGLLTLERMSSPVRIQGSGLKSEAILEPQACYLGTATECFDAPGNQFLNVGSFFDTRQTTSTSHYFLKLYRNDSAGSVQLRGMGFESRSSHGQRSNKFQAAGAIVMGERMIFPKPEALLELSEVEVQGADGEMTCVEFSLGVDTQGTPIGTEIILDPGHAAWLVVRFPTLPDTVFVGVRSDNDATDQPCDYMTNDGGEHWFRPDPLHGPVFDWGITAFTDPRLQLPRGEEPTWTLVKTLYR